MARVDFDCSRCLLMVSKSETKPSASERSKAPDCLLNLSSESGKALVCQRKWDKSGLWCQMTNCTFFEVPVDWCFGAKSTLPWRPMWRWSVVCSSKYYMNRDLSERWKYPSALPKQWPQIIAQFDLVRFVYHTFPQHICSTGSVCRGEKGVWWRTFLFGYERHLYKVGL